MRRFRVDISATIDIEIDDEAVGWDGKGILDLTSERWVPGSTLEDVVGSIAISVGAYDARIGGSDGFADLPEDTVTGGQPWADQWAVDRVEETTP